jgi:PilZ domain-containing protein
VQLRFGLENVEGETIDLSSSGALVKARRIPPPGSPVGVRLHLPGPRRPVWAAGLVVRILAGNQMGIHFDRLALIESERLQEFLLSLVLEETIRPSASAL